jgi:uncharacterized protein
MGQYNNQSFVFCPIGNLNDSLGLKTVMDKIISYFSENNLPFIMKVVPEVAANSIRKMYPKELMYLEDRDNYDYVYSTKDLIELKGRKYHGKKNHINKFISQYDYMYKPITKDYIEQCLQFARQWRSMRGEEENPELIDEEEAIGQALYNFDALGLTGGMLILDNKVEAFTFGEGINNDTAVVHIEKANPDINGLYTAINNFFCKKQLNNFRFVNREEDMGIEGLRKAKLSYYPLKLEKKYTLLKG